EAVEYAEQLRSSRPDSRDSGQAASSAPAGDVLARLGGLYLVSGDLAKGRECLRSWWESDPKNPNVHRLAAEIALRHGDVEGAIASYGRMLTLPPTRPGEEGELEHHAVRRTMAELYERIDRPDEAVKLYLEILDHVPGVEPPAPPGAPPGAPPFGAGLSVGPLTPLTPDPSTAQSQGLTYDRLRAAAIEGMVRVAMRPGGPGLEALLKKLEARIAREPLRQQPYDDLARVLLQARETERMVKVLERARDRFPDAFDWRRDLARAYRDAHRWEDALREYRAVLQLNPGDEELWLDEMIVVYLHLPTGPDELAARVRRIAETGQNLTRVREITDRCAEQGRPDLAARLMTEAVARSPVPPEPDIHLVIAGYLRRVPTRREAVYPHLRKYLELQPRSSRWPTFPATGILSERRSVLARLLQAAPPDAPPRLVSDLRTELAAHPTDVTRWADVALLEQQMGRFDAELAALERLFELRDDPAFITTLLDRYRTRGRLAQARAFVRRVLVDPRRRTHRVLIALAALEEITDLAPDETLTRELVRIVRDGTGSEGGSFHVGEFSDIATLRDRVFLAEFFWKKGRVEDAIDEMRLVVERNDPHTTTALRLAWYLDVAGKRDEALAAARRAASALSLPEEPVDVTGESSSYAARVAQVSGWVNDFRRRGFLDVLRAEMEARLAKHPDEPMRYADAAVVCEAAGDREAALAVTKRLAAKTPDDVNARLAVAGILGRMGRH
ncbi:MAG TPA: tetratricopeptide repeat protein, partial [Planctomycetota bacterium]|nr:tetratricopeptide repeat protein [Planctomycetota bacterium]